MSSSPEITLILQRARAGDRGAWNTLVQLLYPDLKRLARGSISAKQGQTLNTTALVHECYLRLSQAEGAPRDRSHLMSLAVRIMRQVLIDHARERMALKRGGGARAVPVEDAQLADDRQFETLLDIDAALNRLESIEPRQARVFECRYFGGLNSEETAEVLGVSARTAFRDWDAGREWLAAALDGKPASRSDPTSGDDR